MHHITELRITVFIFSLMTFVPISLVHDKLEAHLLFLSFGLQAGLNAITRSLSSDLNRENILVASVHPGWVATDLGGKQADLQPSESISQMLNLFRSMNNSHQGGFYQYNGQQLTW